MKRIICAFGNMLADLAKGQTRIRSSPVVERDKRNAAKEAVVRYVKKYPVVGCIIEYGLPKGFIKSPMYE